jgi:tetratricopeptide (TPR) repeat protein
MQTYSLRDIQSMLGISRAVISRFVASGFITPQRGPRREYRFTFQDVVLLRTAHSLHSASIAPRKIVQALRRLRATLPDTLPLSGLRISAVGNEIVVHDGAEQRQVDSGQLLFDFEIKPQAGTVSALSPTATPATTAAVDPAECFQRGVALEAVDRARAEQAYRQAIAAAPGYVDAVLNLGVMLGEAGRHDEAVQLYGQAIELSPREPVLHFNMAVAMEDAQQAEQALASYERCTKLAPDFADAHFNAARLHEQLGHATQAIRHYSAYRRLQP